MRRASDEVREENSKAMVGDEERVLEEQLELQLREQEESLASLRDALAFDPSNPELLSVQGDLIRAIKDVKDGLLLLKQTRLIQAADLFLSGCNYGNDACKVEATSLNPNNDDELGPIQEQSYSIGSKCRFLHNDGRWYNGQIIALDEFDTAKVSFLAPTTENMVLCKHFMQQRCRFGTSCRLSHGVDVAVSSMRMYIAPAWGQSMVGSAILALGSMGRMWREAELESWDDDCREGNVIFCDDGSSETLGIESMFLAEEEGSSRVESDGEDESPRGLGFLELTVAQRGIQTETAIFARWENHTRGMASKMMANMGYRRGMGLGISSQGMVDPILVKVLPPNQSLENTEDHHHHHLQCGRSRGGKRKRKSKQASLAREAKDKENEEAAVFSLINTKLAMPDNASNCQAIRKLHGNSLGERRVDRQALVAYDSEVKELKLHVKKLEEMACRNQKDKVMYEAAMRKLDDTQKALVEAQAAHESASIAVVSIEKEKKWLKF